MSNYRFNGVPKIQYGSNIITDISHNLTIEWTPGNVFFINYSIKDGDTPENIAYRLWYDSSLSWIICLVNDIIDPFFDWPLRSDELMGYVKNKYGADNINAIHHYVKDGYVVNKSEDPSITTVSNYEYEFALNEEKREIYLPTEVFIQEFLNGWGNL